MILYFVQQAQCVHVGDDFGASLITVHATVGLGRLVVNSGVVIQYVDHGQTVAAAHLVIVEIVRRRDLDAASAEFSIYIIVGNDRDLPAGEGQLYHAPYKVGITLVFRVHCHRAVTQHGFWPGGRYGEVTFTSGQWIVEVPQVALLFLGNYFQVRYRGVQCRVPVDQPLAAVNKPFTIKANKHVLYRAAKTRVHGEALAGPVQGGAQAAQLTGDGAARLFFPLPDFLHELVSPQFVTVRTLCFQLALDHHLGRDAGVIGAHLPQGVIAGHAMVANQRIHDGFLEAVAHMQAAGNVRRRNHDAIGLLAALGGKIAFGLPLLVPAGFNVGGLECLFHQLQNPGDSG